MKKITQWAFRWLLPVPFLIAALFFYTAIPGFSFSGLICLGICGIILCYNVFSLLRPRFPKTVQWTRRVFTALLCLGVLVVSVTCGVVVKTSLQQPDTACDYVVILGCKVNPNGPSLSLQNRIDAAYQYLSQHPNTIAIASGGKGADEPMTEARCIYDALIRRGIPDTQLWLEEQSTSTWENLNFSLDLIQEKTGSRPNTIGLVSSEYHIFRAGLQARDCGVTAVGIPATTSWLALRINNYLREVAGVWRYFLLGGQ